MEPTGYPYPYRRSGCEQRVKVCMTSANSRRIPTENCPAGKPPLFWVRGKKRSETRRSSRPHIGVPPNELTGPCGCCLAALLLAGRAAGQLAVLFCYCMTPSTRWVEMRFVHRHRCTLSINGARRPKLSSCVTGLHAGWNGRKAHACGFGP